MLNLHSIFTSVSGEVGNIPQGTICSFIRLQGCSLNCPWCDTKSAQEEKFGIDVSVEQIVRQITTENVVITGGEPLEQSKGVRDLVKALFSNHRIQIETNGTHVVPRVADETYVVDRKMFLNFPSAINFHSMFKRDLDCFDWVKFVVQNHEELEKAIEEVQRFWTPSRPRLALSVVNDRDGLPCIDYMDVITALEKAGIQDEIVLNFQIHKLVNVE